MIRERNGERERAYRWSGGKLAVVEATHHGAVLASIRLDYDAAGRIASATASTGARARYTYDQGGRLRLVEIGDRTLKYTYSNGRLTDLSSSVSGARHVEYDSAGRVALDRTGGVERRFTYESSTSGVAVTTRVTGGASEEVKHDAAMRPLEERLGDGSVLRWSYLSKGEVRATAALAGIGRWSVLRSADGRRLTFTEGTGATWSLTRDVFGRAQDIQAGGQKAARLKWLVTGQLQQAVFESSAMTPAYDDKDGALTGVMIHPPGAVKGPISEWFRIDWGDAQRRTELRDSRGLVATFRRDGAGRLASMDWNGDHADIRRDSRGRPISIRTSWGQSETRTYDDATESLTRLERAENGQKMVVEYTGARPARIRSFDGGETVFTYAPGAAGALQRIHLPNGSDVVYARDFADALSEVVCGGRYRIRYTGNAKARVMKVFVDRVQ